MRTVQIKAEETDVVAALRDLAGGRADLLAEVAGLLEGFSEGELGEALAWQAADLCRLARPNWRLASQGMIC